MTLKDITAAMQLWANAKAQNDVSAVQGWFSNLNMFSILYDNLPRTPQEQYVHAYPGIVNDQLFFFVIEGQKDTAGNPNILNDIQICQATYNEPIIHQPNGDMAELPEQVAIERIRNWNEYSQQWIVDNTSTIYQCLAIPQNDLSAGIHHNAFFALNGTPGAFKADLIIQDPKSTIISFYDTINPVPPFAPSGALAEPKFYLYSLLS